MCLNLCIILYPAMVVKSVNTFITDSTVFAILENLQEKQKTTFLELLTLTFLVKLFILKSKIRRNFVMKFHHPVQGVNYIS